MQWKTELEDGSIGRIKSEDLAYVTSYTEAEQVAYALIESQNRERHGEIDSLEIIKESKINDILYNKSLDTEDTLINGLIYNFFPQCEQSEGFYRVVVRKSELNEKTGKEKRFNETHYTPASSNTEAAHIVTNYLRGEDIVIRDVRFDNAESVLWPSDVYSQKVNGNG